MIIYINIDRFMIKGVKDIKGKPGIYYGLPPNTKRPRDLGQWGVFV